MASLSEECGYDQDFVDSPPEYLKCIVCHFVLKNPVQLMQCGHRYCELCFERIKIYSKHLNSVLCCPVDREEIDINQVFKDTATRRFIADLHVKCPHNIHGCLWTGELRNLEDHKMQCNHAQKEATIGAAGISRNEVDGSLLKDMMERLNRCEEVLVEKEKDMAHIKFNLQEMKEKVNKRDKEIDELKLKNVDMIKEMKLLQDTSKTLQENVDKVSFKCENSYLSNKNEIDQLKLVRNEEVEKFRIELEDVNSKLIENKNKLSPPSTEERLKSIDKVLKDTQEQLCNVNRDITTKQNNVDKTLSNIKGQVNGLHSKTDKSLNDVKAKVEGFIQEPLNEISNKVDELQAYVTYTSGLLSFKEICYQDTSFVWIIRNFRQHFEDRNEIKSSKFYCRPKGHLCQLYGYFNPGEKDMIPGFRLVKGRNSADVADFEMNISFNILYNDGSKLSTYISSAHCNQYRELCFTFDNNSDVTRGLGLAIEFKQDDLEKYVIDDTCTVVCTLTPSN